MFSFKKSLVAVAGLAALVGLIALVMPASTQGQGGGNQQPLNVNVVNTESAPAFVRDVGVPLRTPVQIKVNTFIDYGAYIGVEEIYTVPAGKRLVIEHVALTSENLAAGNAVRATVVTHFGGEIFDHTLDVRAQAAVAFGGGQLSLVNQQMLAFADAGTVVEVRAKVNAAQGSGIGGYSALLGTLSGYLESVP